jgi:PDZ domain
LSKEFSLASDDALQDGPISHVAPAPFKRNEARRVIRSPAIAINTEKRARSPHAFRKRRALDKMNASMRLRRQVALFAITLAAFAAHMTCALAQSGVTPAQDQSAHDQPDQTLEIAPRIAPHPPAAETPPPAPASDDVEPSTGNTDNSSQQAPAAPHPYLGIAVQTVYSRDWAHGPSAALEVAGLEVVSVDRNSPAAIAGLHGRTKMSSLGESSATVSSLVPPLELLMVPILKKTGSLGQDGDVITAIDDRRVINDFDLASELESLKPGDVIYLTVTRTMANGSQKTLKLPIKLGDAAQAATAAADSEAEPLAPSAAPSAKHP